MNVYIEGYGAYVPRYRIKIGDIASVWGKINTDIEKSLMLTEKSVSAFDEDAVTLAFEAASQAMKRFGKDSSIIEACFVGSESHPYAVNPTSTIVSEFLNVGNHYIAADLEFACKAGSAGMIATAGLIEAGNIKAGLVIGADTAQARPHDILEYTAASAAAAFILGNDKENAFARLVDFTSFSSDTPDFWRRDGVRFPSHGGRFTGEPAYFTHVEGAARLLLDKCQLKPTDFDYCIFHMPNGKFPREAASRLGFSPKQQQRSLIIDHIGNPYSASSLLGLAAVLDQAKVGQKIFMVSYGSGAGSDAFIFEVTPAALKKRKTAMTVAAILESKKYISYIDYLRYSKKI